jgi:phosphoesterase RecJ-like protein
MFAMAIALQRTGCKPSVSLPPVSLSQKLTFLFEWAGVEVATPEDFAAADGFIAVDTAKKGRCNLVKELKETDWVGGRPMIVIDHHETNTRFGTIHWVEPCASSTCEMVFHLLRAAKRPISPVCASQLYAGVHTDTLGFSLPTTTASALHTAAELVGLGANVAELGERLVRSHSKGEFELLKTVHANTKLAAGGRLAYSSASYEEIHGAGCNAADIDDQINVPRSLEGVELAMLFSEGDRGKTRINFRGSGKVTVAELAEEFKGGGHVQAAGAVLDCGLQEAIERVVPRAIEHLKRFEP